MSLHQQPELKKAVLALPEREKDKLLVRLVGKDKMLMKQLHFQLLEDDLDLEERIETLQKQLSELFDHAAKHIRNQRHNSSVLDLLSLMKSASGLVNEHEKVTKDKMSEVACRLFILAESTRRYPILFMNHYYTPEYKLAQYVVGRVKNLYGKYSKLHEDLQFEFRDEFQNVLDFLFSTPTAKLLQEAKIPTEL